MEPKGSLPSTQTVPATGPYPKLDESNPQSNTLFQLLVPSF